MKKNKIAGVVYLVTAACLFILAFRNGRIPYYLIGGCMCVVGIIHLLRRE